MKPEEIDPIALGRSLNQMLRRRGLRGYRVVQLQVQKEAHSSGATVSVSAESHPENMCWKEVSPGRYAWVRC
jgi:hypothetical protein